MSCDTLAHDLRHTFRTLRRDARLFAPAVLIIGLAIDANTAMFGIANALLLRPLAFPHAERLPRHLIC